MKKITLLAGMLFACISVFGQLNLVPNHDFEDTTTQCPTSLSQVTQYCKDWYQYGTATSDYFSTCGTGFAQAPNLSLGYQFPYTGKSFCGFYVFGNTWCEYIYAKLKDTMKIGVKYQVSMSLNLSDKMSHATDNVGAYFFQNGPTSVNNANILPYTPQIAYGKKYGIIKDTQNWVRVTDTFTADSQYQHIIIGAFKNNTTTLGYDTLKVSTTGFNNRSYYFVDSVVVIPFSGLTAIFNDSVLCAGDTIAVYYNSNSTVNNNNVFKVQLSGSTGSYALPIDIGSKTTSATSGSITAVIPTNIAQGTAYRLRVVGSSPADTSNNNEYPIYIGNIDTASVSVSSNSPLCDKSPLQFSSSVNAPSATYSWWGPNGFNATSQNPFISGVSPVYTGDYYSLIKFGGCEVRDTLSVIVYPNPDTPVINHNTPICAGDTLRLAAPNNTSGVTYSWTGPNSFTSGDSSVVIPVSTAAMNGTYTASVTKNGCSSSTSESIVVKPNPGLVTLSVNAPLCEGDTMRVQSTSAGTGVTYDWSGPGSFTANTKDFSRVNSIVNMSGWYKVQLGLNGCGISDSLFVAVNSIPAAPTTTFSNPICVGETLSLTANSLSGAGYSWTGPNSFSSNQQNPVRINVTLADTGTYRVKAINNGCESPVNSFDVSINPQPFVVIFSNKDSLCVGEQVTFTALPNNAGGAPFYQWYVNAQAVGNGTTYTSTGINHNDIIRVDMTEYTKCSQSFTDPSNDIQMTVLPWLAPSVTITSDKTGPVKPYHYITFTATAVNAGNNPKYQWKRNGSDLIGANGSIWSANTLNDNDSISVEIESSYRCPQPKDAVSNGIIVRILTSVGEIDGLSGLTLYPNPNNGVFTLEGDVTKGSGEYSVDIVNAIGQIVYKDVTTISQGRLHHTIRLDAVASGIYLLRLRNADGDNMAIRFRVEGK